MRTTSVPLGRSSRISPACCVQSCGTDPSTGSSIGGAFTAPFVQPCGLGRKGKGKSGTSPITFDTHAPQGTHRNENDDYDRRAACFAFANVPKLPGEVNDKKAAQGSP